MKLKLVFSILFSSVVAFSAQAEDSVDSPIILCNGSQANSGGLKADTQVAVIVQKGFPSGDLKISVAVDGQITVDQVKAEPITGEYYNDTPKGYRSAAASLTIQRAQFSHESDSFSLSINGRTIQDLYLSCIEY